MKVIIVGDKQAMGKTGAEIIAAGMEAKATFVLGLATGSTPVPVYEELIRMHKQENLDFSTTITFNLDEYVGLEPTHAQSYRCFMNAKLFDHVNIAKNNTHVPDGMAADVDAHCEEFEGMIQDVGGIDCQVLGIGGNGHVGFNEPGSSLASYTREVDLTPETIQANARFFESAEEVPKQAVTMGIGTILDAEMILIFASGANKAEAVAQALEGPVTAMVPASALQLHPNVIWVLTEDAASGLKVLGKPRGA